MTYKSTSGPRVPRGTDREKRLKEERDREVGSKVRSEERVEKYQEIEEGKKRTDT